MYQILLDVLGVLQKGSRILNTRLSFNLSFSILKQEAEAAEKLRVERSSLEVRNEKLKLELEETNQKLLLAQAKGLPIDGADSKTWKSKVVTRSTATSLLL